MTYRTPLTETVRCGECATETMKPDDACVCGGRGWIIRELLCGCCGENHRSTDCPFYCWRCQAHHEHGEHRTPAEAPMG